MSLDANFCSRLPPFCPNFKAKLCPEFDRVFGVRGSYSSTLTHVVYLLPFWRNARLYRRTNGQTDKVLVAIDETPSSGVSSKKINKLKVCLH